MNARERGKQGEEIALKYLTNKGYTKITTGFRSRFGEIDIIVKNEMYLVFVEVKLRKNSSFAQARENVGKDKQRKLTSTAMLWLARHKTELQPRFDVIEVFMPDGLAGGPVAIEHIVNVL